MILSSGLSACAVDISAEDIFDEESYLSAVPETDMTNEEILGGILSAERIIELVKDTLLSSADGVLDDMPGVICILIFGMICNYFAGASSLGISASSGLVANYMVFLYLFRLVAEIYYNVSLCLERLSSYVLTLSSVMISFLGFDSYASGAGVMNTFTVVLSSFLSVISDLVMPLVTALIIISALSGISGNNLSSASGMLTGIYMTVSGASVSLLSLIVSFQTKVAAGNDSVLRKGAKLASAYAIPVVGGALSESFDNISMTLSVLRSSFGFGAALLIILSVLPAVISVLFYKLIFSLLGTFCDISGAGGIVTVIRGMDALFSVMLITLALNILAYLYALYLFCSIGA